MNDEVSQNNNPEPEQPAEQSTTSQVPPEQPQTAPAPPPRVGYQQQAPPPPPGGYYAQQGQYQQYAPPPPPRRSNWWLVPLALGGGCLLWAIVSVIFFVVLAAGIGSMGGQGASPRGSHVALIHVTGVITGGESSGGVFNESVVGSEDLVSQLEKIRDNRSVKAVVLRINSPGGSAAGSEEIYRAVQRVRESGKPVYTSMGDVAASGGYYIAAASDKIYADSSTLTGSIGVIFSLGDLSDLYKKIGYKPETIKAGKFKDIGSSSRPLTPEERQLLQALVNDTYSTFLGAVAEGRNMPLAQVKKLAEGRIYSGRQALNAKLVDELGGLHETVRAAAKAGGIQGEPKVVEYGKKGFLESVFNGESESASSKLDDALTKALIKRFLAKETVTHDLR